jgi:hypothetical protein
MAENGKITGIITVPRLSAAGAEIDETVVNAGRAGRLLEKLRVSRWTLENTPANP